MNMRFIAFTIILSFLITLIMGAFLIPFLKRMKFGQHIRQEGPKSHLAKAGTPTMGGFIFLIPLALVSFLLSSDNRDLLSAAVFVTLSFGLIGFIDDYIKVVMKRSLGLRAYQKMIGQIGIAVILAYFAYTHDQIGSSIIIPFIGKEWDLGIMYIPIASFIIVGTVNSVNLTDGLDGLCGSVTLIVAVFFSIILSIASTTTGQYGLQYLSVNYGNLMVFTAALTGACLGFLRFNAHPAQVFMGDTGSLGLGGAIASISILLRLPLLLPLVGGVYMAQSLSVIIQVASFKLRGKRVFKMSPLHHHFELSGMAETKIVAMFMIVTVVLCLIGLMSF